MKVWQTISHFLVPRSLAGQLVCVTIIGLIVTQMLIVSVFVQTTRENFRGRFHAAAILRMADMVQLIGSVETPLRDTLLRAASNRRQHFTLTPPPPPRSNTVTKPRLERRLSALLSENGLTAQDVEIRHIPHLEHRRRKVMRDRDFLGPRDLERGAPLTQTRRQRLIRRDRLLPGDVLLMRVDLGNGLVLHSRMLAGRPPPIWRSPIVWGTLGTALVLAILLIVLARRLARPLQDLTRAAERMGTADSPGDLRERGPDDIKRATRAFNRMNRRLTRLLERQRRMIAAVGHDLRTPLTALRLRAEFVQDEDNRDRMIRTIDEMQALTESILSLIRDETREEPVTLTDIPALVGSLCEDFSDLGADIALRAPARLAHPIRKGALTRVLRNLIDNAVRYGGRAEVSVDHDSNGKLIIRVEDNGPGIDEAVLDQVFEPFVRLEASRSSDTGGLGLGLTIALSLVEADGGHLVLANRADGGLAATITLPLVETHAEQTHAGGSAHPAG